MAVNEDNSFKAGDHVFVGMGKVKHHAIVVKDEDPRGFMEIVEYGAFAHTDGQLLQMVRNNEERGVVRRARIYVRGKKYEWHKVDYAGTDKLLRKAGDVVAAAYFILNNSYLLPAYHLTFCNCECVARWCKRGVFTSGQAKGFYRTSSTMALAATPAIAVVSIPLAPVAAALGMVATGRRLMANKKWSATRKMLEAEFKEYQRDQIIAKDEGFEVIASFNRNL